MLIACPVSCHGEQILVSVELGRLSMGQQRRCMHVQEHVSTCSKCVLQDLPDHNPAQKATQQRKPGEEMLCTLPLGAVRELCLS